MEELHDALRRAHTTSVGPDEIHYQLLKHIPDDSRSLLLSVFFIYKIWFSGDFPSYWRKAIVIPVTKSSKDPTNPTNYRPIALTSCIWNKSSIVDLSGILIPTTCLLTCNAVSDPDVAWLIIF